MPTNTSSLIATRLKDAFVSHGFDVNSGNFEVELRAILGTKETASIVEFFDGRGDIALSVLLSLCDAVSMQASEIIGNDKRETLQIYDYFGGNPAVIKLPYGLAWDRMMLNERLYYTPAPEDTCSAIDENDLLILSRDCAKLNSGEIYMIETDQKMMLRKYVGADPSGQFNLFAKFSEDNSSDMLKIPVGQQSVISEDGNIAAITGKLQFNLRSSQSS